MLCGVSLVGCPAECVAGVKREDGLWRQYSFVLESRERLLFTDTLTQTPIIRREQLSLAQWFPSLDEHPPPSDQCGSIFWCAVPGVMRSSMLENAPEGSFFGAVSNTGNLSPLLIDRVWDDFARKVGRRESGRYADPRRAHRQAPNNSDFYVQPR